MLPPHVRAFRDVLLAVKPAPIEIPGTKPGLIVRPGIRESTRIHFNKKDFQELGRKHEYSFIVDKCLYEMSLQLYEAGRGLWRFFAYCCADGDPEPGMLLSFNLTRGYDGSESVEMRQMLKLSTRGILAQERDRRAGMLADRLRALGLDVTEKRELVFSAFNVRTRKFVKTSATRFVRDFVVAAVIKGHYMRNKDYVLPGFDALAKPEPIRIQSKRTPVGAVAAMAASAAKSGEFDPRDVEDARRKTLAAIVRRQGQPAFRKALLAAYGCRCVVTKCDLEEALEAAHISPYLGEQTNVVSNGLLLRADIHTLFDLGLISIDPETRTVLMTPALRSSEYGAWEGKKILSPSLRNQEPSKLALAKHRRYSGL